jgi:hypothetical protein
VLIIDGQLLVPRIASWQADPPIAASACGGANNLIPSLQSWGSIRLGRFGFNELQFRSQQLIDLLQADAQRIVEEVCVAVRGLHLRVTQEPPNHRQ